jgi:hypothetical protein
MRTFLILTLAFASFTTAARADDSFEIVKNGQTYLCTAEATDPNGAVECVNKAYSGPFSKDESLRLCAGARSTAPADCAIKAYNGPFSKDEALRLCTGAVLSTGPADCATAAYAGPFSKDESLRLCAGNSTLATAQCAIRAYAGPYNKEQAIQLCRNGNPALVSVGLAALLGESRSGFGAVVDKAKLKALGEVR